MSRPIIKTFTVREYPSTPEILHSRSDGRWSSFMNSYAVWPTKGNEVATHTIKRNFNAPYTGIYRFRSSVDNSATVKVDGLSVGGVSNFNTIPTPVDITLTAGDHTLEFTVSNAGDVAGFACTISQPPPGQPNPPPETVLWDTRTNAVVNSSVKSDYSFQVDFNGTVTAHIWGGGGGGGSGDVKATGGYGSSGLYNTTTFTVNKGDVVEVAVGQGGRTGVSGRPCTGGLGGQARININSQASKSFNGGRGGSGPVSGAGGGGGGATAVLVNSSLVLAAGGGGGGGGAGNGSPGASANYENNAMLKSGSIEVQSSNYNVTKDKNTTWIDINGSHVVYGFSRGHTLAVFNSSTLKLESENTYDTYGNENSNALTNALTSVANGKIVAIGSFDATTLSQGTRNILNAQFGGTKTNTWKKSRTSHVFIGIKNGGVEAIEEISAASDSSGIISGTYNTSITVPTEYRGEDGQTRESDGGTGGAGGGGYPGGKGGAVNKGDSGANPGEAGGNYPVRSKDLRGTSSPYYKSQYGLSGAPSSNGNPGYAVLEITPYTQKAAVSAVKVSGTWRQVTAGYVKVSGTWQSIDTAYVKRNGVWRVIRSTGDIGSLADPQATVTNIGRSQRTYT